MCFVFRKINIISPYKIKIHKNKIFYENGSQIYYIHNKFHILLYNIKYNDITDIKNISVVIAITNIFVILNIENSLHASIINCSQITHGVVNNCIAAFKMRGIVSYSMYEYDLYIQNDQYISRYNIFDFMFNHSELQLQRIYVKQKNEKKILIVTENSTQALDDDLDISSEFTPVLVLEPHDFERGFLIFRCEKNRKLYKLNINSNNATITFTFDIIDNNVEKSYDISNNIVVIKNNIIKIMDHHGLRLKKFEGRMIYKIITTKPSTK